MMMLLQQFTGINAIMFYAETIFEQAHFQVGILNQALNNLYLIFISIRAVFLIKLNQI